MADSRIRQSEQMEGVSLRDRWAQDREMFIVRKVTKPDGSSEEVRDSISINGWKKTPDGKWINEGLGITDPID
ncbi:hypothetical protein AGMMS49992_20170 [Clostridia bacterium]|nr:hypothetical protein AGMMS49992_20170 [Clostridia bacterium]